MDRLTSVRYLAALAVMVTHVSPYRNLGSPSARSSSMRFRTDGCIVRSGTSARGANRTSVDSRLTAKLPPAIVQAREILDFCRTSLLEYANT